MGFKFLSYSHSLIQVLGKCAKPIPILIMGVTLGHRRYPVIKYLIVLLIVVGVALFLYKDKGGRSQTEDQTKLFNILGIGEFLLVRPPLSVYFFPTTPPSPN